MFFWPFVVNNQISSIVSCLNSFLLISLFSWLVDLDWAQHSWVVHTLTMYDLFQLLNRWSCRITLHYLPYHFTGKVIWLISWILKFWNNLYMGCLCMKPSKLFLLDLHLINLTKKTDTSLLLFTWLHCLDGVPKTLHTYLDVYCSGLWCTSFVARLFFNV